MATHRCQPIGRPLDATVVVPGSKSITNRALIAAALADGHSLLTGALRAEDTLLMTDALDALGIAVTADPDERTIEITGCGGQIPSTGAELWCGNSGTTIRFCAAMTALGHGRFALDGGDRMRRRPIGSLVDALTAMGAGVEYAQSEGHPPIIVHASGLSGGHVSFHRAVSSQYVSALLLASPYARQDVMIDLTGAVVSRPYLQMTTAVMDAFGVSVLSQYEPDSAKFVVPASQRYVATTFPIEPDASSASYFLAAPAVAGGRVTVEGIGTNSIQGDARFVDVLERMGCGVTRRPSALTVQGPPAGVALRGVDVDLGATPDMVQTLAVVALFATGPTNIGNVANLRVKETDRIAALERELTKLGARVESRTDGLTIQPPTSIRGATIDTYDDHRMAMSFALAGLAVEGIEINDPQCCGKTFPDFFDRFRRMCESGA